MKTTNELIKKLEEIGSLKLKQATEFTNLARSIKQRKGEKTFKEWKEFVDKIIK